MAELLEAGLVLMLVGMGVVFALLAVLVAVVHAVSKLARRLQPEPAVAAPAPGAAAPLEDEVIGVVSAAIQMYRRRHAPDKTEP
jgi:sodium pump decarboxylase gamma subunit